MFWLSRCNHPMRARQGAVAAALCAALALSACGGKTERIASPEPETTTTSAPSEPAAVETPSETETSSDSETPADTETPSDPTSTGFEHNPKLKQLTLQYITVDVPEGWTGEIRDNGEKFDDILLSSSTDKSRVKLVPLNIALSPRKDPAVEAASMCGALTRKLLKSYTDADEGPRDLLRTPDGYGGYACGATGIPTEGPLKGVRIDTPITVISNSKGDAIIQISEFPVKGGDLATGEAAAFMLRQSTFNWAGKPLI